MMIGLMMNMKYGKRQKANEALCVTFLFSIFFNQSESI